MRVDYKKKTEIKEITTQVKVFIAFDGAEFENRYECEKYETEQRNILRQGIESCRDADGYPGFDGNCHSDENFYCWIRPKNEEEIEKLNQCYSGLDLTVSDIDQWIGIEYDDEHKCCGISYLDSCINYAKKLLEKFGLTMKLRSKKESEGKALGDRVTKLPIGNGYLDIRASVDPDYPGLDVEFIPDNETDGTYRTRPRVLIERPNGEGLRVLVWADPRSEDYSDEIEFGEDF